MAIKIRYPVFKPKLFEASSVYCFLDEIDQNRWYTNHGPLVRRFEQELSKHFAVESDRVITASNATLALSIMLKALGAPAGSTCVVPSWTFIATPAAACWAGLDPYFVDVDADTWVITPEAVRDVMKHRTVGAVIVVSAFGAPVDVAPWLAFREETGIPVLIDAAAGFDGFKDYGHLNATIPVVVSFHATKVSGIGEGAAIITHDGELEKTIGAYANFGFAGTRIAEVIGLNAKLSEYMAANGLAFLRQWPQMRKNWQYLSNLFAAEVARSPGVEPAPGFDEGWVSSYGQVRLPASVSADDLAAALKEVGIESRQWWGKGCHLQPAYRSFACSKLPVTNRLGASVLGLPFWIDLEANDFEVIFDVLRSVMMAKGNN